MQKRDLDEWGRSELINAIIEGDLTFAAKLLRLESNVNHADKRMWTGLHFAAQEQNIEAVKLLLEAGAAVDPIDEHGNTPLFRAVFSYRGNAGVIPVLLEAGADPNHKNCHGISPKELAFNIANYDSKKFFS